MRTKEGTSRRGGRKGFKYCRPLAARSPLLRGRFWARWIQGATAAFEPYLSPDFDAVFPRPAPSPVKVSHDPARESLPSVTTSV